MGGAEPESRVWGTPRASLGTPELSVVLGTYQRRERLQECVAGVRRHTRAAYELVVVDGGSTDGSAEWLREQPDVRLVVERQRAGCCRAYDTGFRLARGEFVAWLNDDATPQAGALDAGLGLLRRPDMADVGLVALYHTHRDPWNELHGFEHEGRRWGVLHVRGYPYANFGVLRRGLLERLGYLDLAYRFCAWDPDLALKVQREAGLKVLGCPAARVLHEELVDERKAADAGETRRRDNERLFAKWRLPGKGEYADPRPAYAELLRARGQQVAKN